MSALATPRKGFDNTAELGLATMNANGFDFAMRYLSRYTSKVVTGTEYQDYKREGKDLGLVFEDGAARATGGYEAGKLDAEFSLQQGKDRLGIEPRVIYFAVDFDVAGNPGVTDAYFDGVAAVMGKDRCGPYGGIQVVSHQLNRGFKYAWQTYAWSNGQRDPRAQVHQYLNTNSWDYNHAYYEDFGQVGIKSGPWRPDYSKMDATVRDVPVRSAAGKVVHVARTSERKALEEYYGEYFGQRRHDWLAELSHRLVYLRKRVWHEAVSTESPVTFGNGNPLPSWNWYARGYRWKELTRATDPKMFNAHYPKDPHGAPLAA